MSEMLIALNRQKIARDLQEKILGGIRALDLIHAFRPLTLQGKLPGDRLLLGIFIPL